MSRLITVFSQATSNPTAHHNVQQMHTCNFVDGEVKYLPRIRRRKGETTKYNTQQRLGFGASGQYISIFAIIALLSDGFLVGEAALRGQSGQSGGGIGRTLLTDGGPRTVQLTVWHLYTCIQFITYNGQNCPSTGLPSNRQTGYQSNHLASCT